MSTKQQHIKWQYYCARKFSLQRYQIVLNVLISDFYWKHFQVRLKNILIKPEEGGNHGIWMEKHELAQMQRRVFRVVCSDLKSFYVYKRMIKRTQQAFVRETHIIARRVSPRISNRQLLSLYDRFTHYHQEHFNKPIWIVFPIEPLLADSVGKALKAVLKRYHKLKEYDKWLEVIFSPEEQNAITALQERLLQLAFMSKATKDITRIKRDSYLTQIADKFGFIPCYDVIDTPWDVEYFKRELNNLLKKDVDKLRKELFEAKIRFDARRNAFKEFLKKFSFRKRERELCIMAHELIFLKDERDDYRRMGSFLGRVLFEEIGRRLGLTLRETCYLTIEETRQNLLQGIAPSLKTKVRQRMKGYVLLRKHDRPMEVFSGDELLKVLQGELGTRQETSLRGEITGVIGSSGKAHGKVCIVHTKHDLRHVQEGAIMVAVTTNPDYVPAMRKCRAIVTDEGGITSHAAIVCREIGLPCIVGTKDATKVLYDGDRVEVDANKGLVRKT